MTLSLPQPWRPTPEQKLLLRACTAPDPELPERMRAWESGQPWRGIDGGSHRLLPFLYRRVERAGVDSTVLPRLKGVYIRYWTQYEMTTPPLLAEVRGLNAAGFNPLLLKGTALQASVYGGDAPTRPSADVDVLLPAGDVSQVVNWLEIRGYTVPSFFDSGEQFSTNKSLGLSKENRELDLNWWLYPFGLDPQMEARMMNRSVSVIIDDAAYATLALEDHLLHALLHGSGANEVPPIRWMLDAHLIAEELSNTQWHTFVKEVAAGGYRIPVGPMLDCLVSELGTPVPHWVLTDVAGHRASMTGLMVQWHLSLPYGRRRQVSRALFAQYLADRDLTKGRPWRHSLTRAPRVTWGVLQEYRARQRRRSHTPIGHIM